jgi:hypothetical protein
MDSTSIPKRRLYRKRLLDDQSDAKNFLNLLLDAASVKKASVIDEVVLYEENDHSLVSQFAEPAAEPVITTLPTLVASSQGSLSTADSMEPSKKKTISQKRSYVKKPSVKNQRKKRSKSVNLKDNSKVALFIQLARPDEKGISRWVNRDEWVGKYASLALGNGLSWGRKGSKLDEMFIIEKDRSQTNGNSIDAIRLNGLKK